MNDTTSDPPKLSWWRRLSNGLKRTSSSLGTAVADLVTKRKLDRAMLDDIEDVLLRADLGTSVAVRIADAVGTGQEHGRIAGAPAAEPDREIDAGNLFDDIDHLAHGMAVSIAAIQHQALAA